MPTPDDSADARQKRVEDLLKAVAGGANLGEETLKMSNEFTDEFTAKLGDRVKRLFGRKPR